jgi:hypothetical protein
MTLFFVCFALFLASVSSDFPCTAHAFFPERLSNHCQGVRRTFSARSELNFVLFLCWTPNERNDETIFLNSILFTICFFFFSLNAPERRSGTFFSTDFQSFNPFESFDFQGSSLDFLAYKYNKLNLC